VFFSSYDDEGGKRKYWDSHGREENDHRSNREGRGLQKLRVDVSGLVSSVFSGGEMPSPPLTKEKRKGRRWKRLTIQRGKEAPKNP